MNILRHIITASYKSLYDFKWITLQKDKTFLSFVYFFAFFFVIVSLRGLFFVQDIPKNFASHWEVIYSSFPKEFYVEKNDSGLSLSGLDQPYITEFKDDNYLVTVYIDTVSTSSVSVDDVIGDSATDKYLVLVTSKKFKFYDPSTKKTVTEDIGNLPNFSFTKEQIGNEVVKLKERMFPGLFFVGVLIFTIFFGAEKLFYLLFLSWFVYIFSRADKKAWRFAQVYTIGLYAITLAILVQWGLTFFYLDIPYIYSILAFVMMYLVIYRGTQEDKGGDNSSA